MRFEVYDFGIKAVEAAKRSTGVGMAITDQDAQALARGVAEVLNGTLMPYLDRVVGAVSDRFAAEAADSAKSTFMRELEKT